VVRHRNRAVVRDLGARERNGRGRRRGRAREHREDRARGTGSTRRSDQCKGGGEHEGDPGHSLVATRRPGTVCPTGTSDGRTGGGAGLAASSAARTSAACCFSARSSATRKSCRFV